MNSVFINGSIEITNNELFNILKSVNQINASKLELNLKDFGHEINYDYEHIYIYVYGNELNEIDKTVIFDCEFKESIILAQEFIENIKFALKEKKISYFTFEYWEGDQNGNIIGEEFEINSEN